jgi:hypothetical protein
MRGAVSPIRLVKHMDNSSLTLLLDCMLYLMDCIHLPRDRDQWYVLVNTVMNLRVT